MPSRYSTAEVQLYHSWIAKHSVGSPGTYSIDWIEHDPAVRLGWHVPEARRRAWFLIDTSRPSPRLRDVPPSDLLPDVFIKKHKGCVEPRRHYATPSA
jgi:hypothetical protein